MSNLPCSRLLLIACGSAHAAALVDYLIRLRQEAADEIKLVPTEAAMRFIAMPAVRPLVSDLVTSMWDPSPTMAMPHIQLVRWAQTVLVLPATANMLGKAANGIADDLASTLMLTAAGPVIFAPAMNEVMWRSAAVRRNVERLRADGHYVIEPAVGDSILSAVGESDDVGVGPTPELVVTHTTHVVLRQLRDSYLPEATAEAPRTPASGGRGVRRPGDVTRTG